MNNRKKIKTINIVLIALLIFIPFVSIGYSALSTVLNIRGSSGSFYL